MFGQLVDTYTAIIQWAGSSPPWWEQLGVVVGVLVGVWVLRVLWPVWWPVVLLAWNLLLIVWATVRWAYWVGVGLLSRAVNASDGTYRLVDGRRVVAKQVPRLSLSWGAKRVIPVPELSLSKQLALKTRREWNRMRDTVAPIVLARDEWYCQWCDTGLHEDNWSIDHVIPISKGGTNELHNLQAMCRSCNSIKGTRSDSWGKFWDRVAA